MITIYIFQTIPSIKAKLIDNTNPLILVNNLTLTALFRRIIKFHGLNLFTTEQRKLVYQAKKFQINKIKLFMYWNG